MCQLGRGLSLTHKRALVPPDRDSARLCVSAETLSSPFFSSQLVIPMHKAALHKHRQTFWG